MKKARFLLTVTLSWLCISYAAAQNATINDGTIVEQTPCAPSSVRTYEHYVEAFTRFQTREVEDAKREGFSMALPTDMAPHLVSREEFEHRRAYAGFECRRLRYVSDGLKVVGFLWKPQDTAGKQFPLIIFNRGGNREFGKPGSFSFLFGPPFPPLQRGARGDLPLGCPAKSPQPPLRKGEPCEN